jgi:hypothetical protein
VRKKNPSKAYLRFESVIRRSLNLLTIQEAVSQIWKATKPDDPQDLTDISRGAVVLAVAAMDSYFTDIFVERMIPFIKRKGPTKDLAKLLGDAGLDAEFALQLIAVKVPFRKIKRLVETHLDRMTTQKMDVIDKLFAVYGIKDFTKNVANHSKKGDRLLIAVNKLVQRRHLIAHEGDLNSHSQPRSADVVEFRRRMKAVVLFVSNADELLHKQMS